MSGSSVQPLPHSAATVLTSVPRRAPDAGEGPGLKLGPAFGPAFDPVLDVLIPHYADPEGLDAALDSIAAQDWLADPANRLQVIVVDDGSAADVFAEVEAICARFRTESGQALRLDRLARNMGRPIARNRLLDLACAPYLAWLDAGDIWYPGKLRAQFAHLAALEATGHDPARLWVSCTYDWDQGARRVARVQKVAGDQLAELLTGDHLRAYLWTLLGRAEAFAIAGRFDAQLPRLQDLDYFLTFLRAGGVITVPPEPTLVPQPLCCYFKSDLGRDARHIAAGHARIMARHAPCIGQYPRAFRARIHQKGLLLAARFARSNGARLLAARYVAAAVFVSPLRSLSLVIRQIRRKLGRLFARPAVARR